MTLRTYGEVRSFKYFFAAPAYTSDLDAASPRCVVTTAKFVFIALNALAWLATHLTCANIQISHFKNLVKVYMNYQIEFKF